TWRPSDSSGSPSLDSLLSRSSAANRLFIGASRSANGQIMPEQEVSGSSLQRGPRIYLFALKNEEASDRMYALDRMTGACMLPVAARKMKDFDLDKRIQDGRADFADGENIQLKAYVSGYIEQLLYDCPMNESQILIPQDQEGSVLTVDVPASGQLLRWLLAAGNNIVLQEPDKLRVIIKNQVSLLNDAYQQQTFEQ
ncbi:WYL domain-containing protein, partial [Laribacter hongkongensis]|uniref:WYL domain-containing protein n=1 Tax=Laribacter hongkongensis TaxID=168471 RepID=UPI001EFEA9AA